MLGTGKLDATSDSNGIYANNINLSWTNATDFIDASSYGGDGADTFIFQAGDGKDTILDFANGDMLKKYSTRAAMTARSARRLTVAAH